MASSSSSSSVNKHFFKPLLPGFHTRLMIPNTFYSNFIKGREKGFAELRSDVTDLIWKVKMEGQKLTEGWDEFAIFHDLQIGDIIVFKHEGNLLFHVRIFGPSCCEVTFSNSHFEGVKEKPRKTKKVKTESSAQCSSDQSEFIVSVTASNLESDALTLPRHFTRFSGLRKQCNEIIIKDGKSKPWKLVTVYLKSSNRFRVKIGWRLFCLKNDFKAGDFMKLKLIRNYKTAFLQLIRSEKKIEIESSEAKNERVEESSCSIFMVLVTSSNLNDDRVILPVRFSKSKITKKGLGEIDLMNKEGKTWRVNLQYMKSMNRFRISKGWRIFCEENGIKDGSNLRFELVRNMTTPLLLMSCQD